MKTSRLLSRTLLPALALFAATSTAWGAAYRWTDPSGNVVYGDQPPTGADAQRMQAPPPPPLAEPGTTAEAQPSPEGAATAGSSGPAAEAAGSEAAPSAEALARDQQRRAQEQRQQAQIRQRNCQAARNNIEMLQRNRPVRIEQEGTSKSRKVSAEEREQAINEARKQIRENCN